MAAQHYVIVIYGLGDHRGRRTALHPYWRWLGIEGEIYRVIWRDKSPSFEEKLNKLTACIDEQTAKGKKVSLIGISAGASAAVNAYMRRRDSIHKVVFVCGRLGKLDLINISYYRRAPAFQDSIQILSKNLTRLELKDKKKMLSLRPLYDEIVAVSTAEIPGVRNKRIISIGHVPSIVVAMTFYSPLIAKFIKSN